MSIAYDCERCGAELETHDSFAGKKDTCPVCGHSQIVPQIKARSFLSSGPVFFLSVTGFSALLFAFLGWLWLRSGHQESHPPVEVQSTAASKPSKASPPQKAMVNPIALRVHEILRSSGYLFTGDSWEKAGSPAIHLTVEGTGDGKFYRKVTRLSSDNWSSSRVMIDGNRVLVEMSGAWREVARGGSGTSESSRPDPKGLARDINRGYMENREELHAALERAETAARELVREGNRKPWEPGYPLEVRKKAALAMLMDKGYTRDEAEKTVEAMVEMDLLPDPPRR